MTNFEYFKDEIIAMVSVPNCTASSLAVVNGEPRRCCNTTCVDCEFRDTPDIDNNSCTLKRKAWLNAEHIEKPKLTKKERQFCKLVETGWIARDLDGEIDYRPMDNKPHKHEDTYWIGEGKGVFTSINEYMPNCNFSFITWDDKEPWSVEELLKLEYEQ